MGTNLITQLVQDRELSWLGISTRKKGFP